MYYIEKENSAWELSMPRTISAIMHTFIAIHQIKVPPIFLIQYIAVIVLQI